MNTEVMFSSKSEEWETPQWLFDELNAEFNFTLDVCATPENAKCARFFTKKDNGLLLPWDAESSWCNPPYGRGVGYWVGKAYLETGGFKTRAVMLLPARTDTKWFHEFIYNKKWADIRFLKGRLKFGNAKNSAPFPSMVVIFGG